MLQWDIYIYDGLYMEYPPVMTNSLLLEMAHRKFVDLPNYKMVIFQFAMLIYQRVNPMTFAVPN